MHSLEIYAYQELILYLCGPTWLWAHAIFPGAAGSIPLQMALWYVLVPRSRFVGLLVLLLRGIFDVVLGIVAPIVFVPSGVCA